MCYLYSELIPCFGKRFARKKYGCRFQWYITFHVSFNNEMKFKDAAASFTYTLYTHSCSLQKCEQNHMENPVLSPSEPTFRHPPPLGPFLSFFFQSFIADENKYSGLGMPKNNFSGRTHAEKSLYYCLN